MHDLPQLDPVIHGQVRLAIMAILSSVAEADFTYLRDHTGCTDGNIGAHLLKLEEAGYVVMSKRFAARKPVTTYRLSAQGRKAFASYVRDLRRILGHSV